jgi:hypothetical protein
MREVHSSRTRCLGFLHFPENYLEESVMATCLSRFTLLTIACLVPLALQAGSPSSKPGNPGVAGLLNDLKAQIAEQQKTIDALRARPPAPVPKTGQTICWGDGGLDTVPCAGTGQDGALQKGVAWPTPRFTLKVNASEDTGAGGGTARNGVCDGTEVCNGTIRDHLTGLIWLRDAGCLGQRDWAGALTAANTLQSGACGLTDGSTAGQWRLPNVRELHSLVNYGSSPALPGGHPFENFQSNSSYWSSTTDVETDLGAWTVGFFYGNVGATYKANDYYVLAVRGGSYRGR